jgi:16S rRNA (adenine1518-N6/adenine1519-N6)-dimethyltransferase
VYRGYPQDGVSVKAQAPRIRHEKGGFKAKQALGQHFIKDEGLLDQLVAHCGVGKHDAVFEIGAGLGGLTAAIGRRARQVISLEVDPQLMPILAVTLYGVNNVQIVEADVMQADLEKLLTPLGPFHVIANLPYYLTTPILNLLFRLPLPVQSINVMVQREAAARVIAAPGTPSYGPLAVLAQYRAAPRVVMDIPASAFTPSPKTDSVFICMPLRDTPAVPVRDEACFFRLVQAAFAMRRKTLLNNLMPVFGISRLQGAEAIEKAQLSPTIRGETLSLQEFARLSDILGR